MEWASEVQVISCLSSPGKIQEGFLGTVNNSPR